MNLTDVLARVPFLSGYEGQNQLNQQRESSQLAQAGGLMQLMQQAQRQQEGQRQIQKLQAYEQAVRGLGPNPTQEQLVGIASQFGSPEKVMDVHQKSLDRASLAEEARKSRLAEIEARGNEAIQRLREQAVQNRITKEEADRREAAMRETMVRLTASLRPAPQQRASSYKDIIDPLDPSKMISVNVDTYNEARYKAGDRSGVLGVAGKEPTAAKRDQEKDQGKRQISTIVENLGGYYDDLEQRGAVVKPGQPAVKNIYERAAASGIGQTVAGFVGTKAQETRDKIANSKPLLMAAIKQASGLSSQMLNSNAELQFYLQAATDPARSLAANRAALDHLDKTYGLGSGVKADPKEVEALKKQAPRNQAGGKIDAPSGGVKFLGFEQ